VLLALLVGGQSPPAPPTGLTANVVQRRSSVLLPNSVTGSAYPLPPGAKNVTVTVGGELYTTPEDYIIEQRPGASVVNLKSRCWAPMIEQVPLVVEYELK